MKSLDFASLSTRLRQCLVQVSSGKGGGSGVIWEAKGLVVTNAHVVRGEAAEVIDAAANRSSARVISRDHASDLVLLRTAVPLAGVPVEIANSDRVRAGQLVIAAGNPLGLTGAVTAGVIHTTGSDANRRWIQADVRLAPGNSGGLLADASGCLIGITTMIVNGLALAVPSNVVAAFVGLMHLKRTA
jgi:serine protease Do